MNALDGVHLGAPTLDASIVHNRIRNNCRRVEGPASRRGEGVTYSDITIRDTHARWRPDGHKGKMVLVAGQAARVATNTEQELRLFPSRPGASTAWTKDVPQDGTLYVIKDEAPAARAGVGIAAPTANAWIRGNRIWDNQDSPTQTRDVYVADDAQCRDCRIEDNG
jgi:hypothetical protein